MHPLADFRWVEETFHHFDVAYWPVSAVNRWAEHVCSAQVFQTSTCSAIARASSNSMPRYRTVLSILVCPSKS